MQTRFNPKRWEPNIRKLTKTQNSNKGRRNLWCHLWLVIMLLVILTFKIETCNKNQTPLRLCQSSAWTCCQLSSMAAMVLQLKMENYSKSSHPELWVSFPTWTWENVRTQHKTWISFMSHQSEIHHCLIFLYFWRKGLLWNFFKIYNEKMKKEPFECCTM